MANYLKFDVYDLELASIYSNHELRRVLLSTTNHSILVIEDIDCTVDLKNRKLKDKDYSQLGPNKLTLSGLLNFIDGLWSSCGDERIIVFTTNHKDRLDPALLRSGRMDVHIHLSYCTTSGVDRERRGDPCRGSEELMKSDDADGALQGLVNFLKRKKVESNKTEDEIEESTEKAKRQKTDEGEETE
ncbi:hypothetical protein L3X38_039335 [Prunus dulcis]|uniref:ATPase AAA-type core domain-containing protein n=1 Tax=Prunus dulcis TaxID=3755 RepID=A0AAD4YRC2_PRUDU|nr:hypothetical protein L3X38_039335 [Prunus dulcis]